MTRTPEQDERRSHVIDAVYRNLTDDLREVGWLKVFDTIETGWTIFDNGRPVNRLPQQDRLAWVSLLGHLEAGTVLAALRMWPEAEGGSHCPKPAELANMMNGGGRGRDPQPTNQPPSLRRDQEVVVLLLVSAQIAAGEPVCECTPAPPTLVLAANGILFCPGCAGIEAGQADQAREHVAPHDPQDDVPVHDLSAVLRLHRVRQERAARVIEERRLAS